MPGATPRPPAPARRWPCSGGGSRRRCPGTPLQIAVAVLGALLLLAWPGSTVLAEAAPEAGRHCSSDDQGCGCGGSCEAPPDGASGAADGPAAWHQMGGFASSGAVQYTNIAVSADNATFVGFRDLDTAGSKATVVRFDAQRLSWWTLGGPGFSRGFTALHISMAVHPTEGLPWLAYTDGGAAHGGGTGRARVMRFDGGSQAWLHAGGGDVAVEAADVGKLIFAGGGAAAAQHAESAGAATAAAAAATAAAAVPYLAAVERSGAHAGRVSVFYLEPGAVSWSVHGARGLSPPGSQHPSLGHWAWSSGGQAGTTMRVAYSDGQQGGRLSCRISLCPSCPWAPCPGTQDGFAATAVADVDFACAMSAAGRETPCYLFYLDDSHPVKVWSSSLFDELTASASPASQRAAAGQKEEEVTVVWDGSADRQEHVAVPLLAEEEGDEEGPIRPSNESESAYPLGCSQKEAGEGASSRQRGAWSSLGLPRASASHLSLALDPERSLLVAFRDGSAGGRAVVMRSSSQQ